MGVGASLHADAYHCLLANFKFGSGTDAVAQLFEKEGVNAIKRMEREAIGARQKVFRAIGIKVDVLVDAIGQYGSDAYVRLSVHPPIEVGGENTGSDAQSAGDGSQIGECGILSETYSARSMTTECSGKAEAELSVKSFVQTPISVAESATERRIAPQTVTSPISAGRSHRQIETDFCRVGRQQTVCGQAFPVLAHKGVVIVATNCALIVLSRERGERKNE